MGRLLLISRVEAAARVRSSISTVWELPRISPPDNRFVGFTAGGKLKKMSLAGGLSETLCDSDGWSGSWNNRGTILFENDGSLHQTNAGGGACVPLRSAEDGWEYRWPEFLPGGEHFLYVAFHDGRGETRVGALHQQGDRLLFPGTSRVVFAEPGYLLFVRNGALMAQGAGPVDAVVSVTTQPTLVFGNPAPVRFGITGAATGVHRPYDILPDGKRFIGVAAADQTGTGTATNQINVVLNWFEELKRRVPAK